MRKNVYLKNVRLSAVVSFVLILTFVIPAQTSIMRQSAKLFSAQTDTKNQKKRKRKLKMNKLEAKSLTAGEWGGVGINLIVENNGASIEYDCAAGAIKQKITLDSLGNFTAQGTYTRRTPGPIRVNISPKSQPALFAGKISGSQMTLKVTLTETNETLEEMTLERGVTARLRKCY